MSEGGERDGGGGGVRVLVGDDCIDVNSYYSLSLVESNLTILFHMRRCWLRATRCYGVRS